MNNLNKFISFYTDLYKDLDVNTIRLEIFFNMIRFDILTRFDYLITDKELNYLIEAVKNNIGGN